MKKLKISIILGFTAFITFLFSISTGNVYAQAGFCETTGYWSNSENKFICDGGGSTKCVYRCPKKEVEFSLNIQ